MDDIVILDESKDVLKDIYLSIKDYLNIKLRLEIKGNWQIFPINSRQIDFCGYRVNHYGIMLRKKILHNFYRKLKRHKSTAEINTETQLKRMFPSHYGWIKHTTENHRSHILNNSITWKN